MLLSEDYITLTAPGGPSVSSELAKNPTEPIHQVAERLFKRTKVKAVEKLLDKLSFGKKSIIPKAEPTEEDLDIAAKCGAFTTRPSDLFLKMYTDVLLTLENDPLAGVVSPSLLAATGVIPISVVSVIPDLIHHYCDVIVRAQHEVYFATNFWEASDSATAICDAFRELNKRAGARGQKVVVKMIYDRGTPSQVIDPHQIVDVETYTGERVKLPHPEEIPHLDLEVCNFHKPPVGTFHAKYLVVDRSIACLNSNNIQDRVNVEMLTHIEGPIVQGFYDMALISWGIAMNPPLPLLTSPPPPQTTYDFGEDHQDVQTKDLDGAPKASLAVLKEHQEGGPDHSDLTSKFDADNYTEAEAARKKLASDDEVNTHLNVGTKIAGTATRGEGEAPFRPHILHARHAPFPMVLVNRRPHGRPGHEDTKNPQNAAFLAAFKYAQKKVFIQTPTFNAPLVVDAAIAAVKRGIEVIIYADLGFNDEGELLPFQGGTNEMVAARMYKELDTDAERDLLKIYWYTGKDQSTPLNFKDKTRNCHVKILIVDDAVGIQGNGNQDVQSWYHSQEINVMVDSEAVCKEWAAGLDANQNTRLHGEIEKDGVWRDKDGKTLPGALGVPKGPFTSLLGVKGAIQRVRGEGGF